MVPVADSSTLSFRVDSQIIDRLEEAASDVQTSRSGVAREALLVGLELLADPETGEIDVPEHVAHDAKVQRLIARNKKERRQGKFRSEFSKQLKASFKNNETPGEFRNSVAGYIEEAEDMGEIPEDVRDRIDSNALTYAEWCEEMLDYYEVAYQSQNFEHDPIDDPLGNHEGIENARQWINRAENIAEAARPGGSIQLDPKVIAQRALTDGVVPEHVQEQAEQQADSLIDGIVSAAEQAAENRALTATEDNPELE